ncbi:MAG: hypothetical protein LBP54_08930 [Campylobacteraceae bacterium]|nr:hypothetical protein [Campylobacteraceae bacterium]
MAFVNEVISKEDYIKYDLETMNKRLSYGCPARDWTIDRERNIWFRLYLERLDRDDNGAELSTIWDFYWKGSLISVETITLDRTLSDDGYNYGYLKILAITTTEKNYVVHREIDKKKNKILINFPKELLSHKQEILKDLKEAFEASYIGLGIYVKDNSRIKICKVDLEYEGELI